jgi:phospholipid/cholesterol/gamma-HCH transport system ATP-binding protein
VTPTETAVLPRSEEPQRAGNGDGSPEDLETEISIRGLTKSFGSQTILEDITCDIPKGKITLMLGPSGTGKSVFLKNVMGLLKPERGEIWIEDKDIVKLGSRDLYKVRRKFGVLFQDGALFGSMNVFDNVAFPLREHTRKPEREIKDIVDEKLRMVGLQGAEKKLPGEISGGMKKRAGLARALVLDPEIVMFDEPDSGLDPVRTAFLNELILDLSRKLGATFIVVTHDIATARRVADFIGMLYLRNLVRFDTKERMFDSDIPVVRQFLAGATEGPIGMSEEADAGRSGKGEEAGFAAVSTSGMTAKETEALERDAGAPVDEERRRTQVAVGAGPGQATEDEHPSRRAGDTPEPAQGFASAFEREQAPEVPDHTPPGETKARPQFAVGTEQEGQNPEGADVREERPEDPTGVEDDPQTEPDRPAGGSGDEPEPAQASKRRGFWRRPGEGKRHKEA